MNSWCSGKLQTSALFPAVDDISPLNLEPNPVLYKTTLPHLCLHSLWFTDLSSKPSDQVYAALYTQQAEQSPLPPPGWVKETQGQPDLGVLLKGNVPTPSTSAGITVPYHACKLICLDEIETLSKNASKPTRIYTSVRKSRKSFES